MPDIRKKLIELIRCADFHPCKGTVTTIGSRFNTEFIEDIADYLIASDFFEELQNEAYDLGVDSALHNHFGLSWEDAAGLRKEVKRLQDATRWIPVTERLPEELGKFRVLDCDRKAYGIAIYNPKKKCWTLFPTNNSKPWKVTHWMSLPEPPKGD